MLRQLVRTGYTWCAIGVAASADVDAASAADDIIPRVVLLGTTMRYRKGGYGREECSLASEVGSGGLFEIRGSHSTPTYAGQLL